jgi:enoyl-[acyl-carrier protein] reductase I
MPKGELMKGKKGLVMGVANHNSIAWGITQQLAAQGAQIALTYLGEGLERRVRPLGESIGIKTFVAGRRHRRRLDGRRLRDDRKEFGGELDFLVHSVAFANKDELKGSFVENTTREGFLTAMNISVFSFVDAAGAPPS